MAAYLLIGTAFAELAVALIAGWGLPLFINGYFQVVPVPNPHFDLFAFAGSFSSTVLLGGWFSYSLAKTKWKRLSPLGVKFFFGLSFLLALLAAADLCPARDFRAQNFRQLQAAYFWGGTLLVILFTVLRLASVDLFAKLAWALCGGLVFTMIVRYLSSAVYQLSPWLVRLSLPIVYWQIKPLTENAIIDSASQVVGLARFGIRIEPDCSGYERRFRRLFQSRRCIRGRAGVCFSVTACC